MQGKGVIKFFLCKNLKGSLSAIGRQSVVEDFISLLVYVLFEE